MKIILNLALTFSFVFSLFHAEAARASIATVTCQVFSSSGNEITQPVSFIARSRMERSIQVTNDGIVLLRWPYFASPVEVTMEYNPHYPFNIPFTTKTLGKVKLGPDAQGLMSGTVDLTPILTGAQLRCTESGN